MIHYTILFYELNQLHKYALRRTKAPPSTELLISSKRREGQRGRQKEQRQRGGRRSSRILNNNNNNNKQKRGCGNFWWARLSNWILSRIPEEKRSCAGPRTPAPWTRKFHRKKSWKPSNITRKRLLLQGSIAIPWRIWAQARIMIRNGSVWRRYSWLPSITSCRTAHSAKPGYCQRTGLLPRVRLQIRIPPVDRWIAKINIKRDFTTKFFFRNGTVINVICKLAGFL